MSELSRRGARGGRGGAGGAGPGRGVGVGAPGERGLTFGPGRVARVGQEAGEADVQRAAEAAVDGRRGGVAGGALAVVELPAHGDHAAPRLLAALPAHEAGVEPCRQRGRAPRGQSQSQGGRPGASDTH